VGSSPAWSCSANLSWIGWRRGSTVSFPIGGRRSSWRSESRRPWVIGCTARWGWVGGMTRSGLTLDSNVLSDIPTNSQLILRILRDAEHVRHPLPPVSTKPDEVSSEASDDDSAESSMKSKVGGRTKKVTATVRDGTRARLRRAWDRLGRVKEEVSSTWVRIGCFYRCLYAY
jgi:hypothetical protein